VFSQEAVALIHECSRGIPRSISVICDNALVSGMALGRPLVDRAVVTEVCRDLRLIGANPQSAAVPGRPARLNPPPAAPAFDEELSAESDTQQDPRLEPKPRRSLFGFRFAGGGPRTSTRIVTE
jgi:hypothetical protein